MAADNNTLTINGLRYLKKAVKKWNSRKMCFPIKLTRAMSTKIFKEILKPCSNLPSSSSSFSSSTSTSTSTSSSIPTTRRIPPKTSISHQLDNLFPSTLLHSHPSNLPPPSSDPAHPGVTLKQPRLLEDNIVVHGDSDGDVGEKKPKLDVFTFGETGPYLPLVLSSPGELPLIQVPASINCRLLEHQREGVKFLYQMYKGNHGGILGDDMGLGKTIQTIAFLAAVFGKDAESSDLSSLNKNPVGKKAPVLIICPASVLQNWENEFSNWSTFRVSIYHGPNRDLILDKVEAQGLEVMITSFDSFRIYGDTICEVQWDIVIVDEAHRLKNEKSKLYTACLNIQTKKRYGLTGTVMQNKIMELYNLFDWVAPGSLGTREHFRDFYDEPLKLGQRSNAPEKFVQIADERKGHLAVVLRKYLLRRTKEESIGNLMLGKEDNVVFCEMSELQKRAYRRMLQLPEIQCLINKDLPCPCGSPLTQVECHKRTVEDGIIWKYLHRDSPDGCNLCPFCVVLPCILKLQQISNHLELIKPNPKDDPEKQKKDADLAKEVFGSDIDSVGGPAQNEDFMGLSDVRHCGKMKALDGFLSSWISHGDKVLLFSYSVRMLDILEKYLIRKGFCFSRLDGSTPTGSRQSLVNDFNSSPSKQVFLVSTRAGGLGLNLVSANRVVIFDPNWNPSHDLQAQDRSFRLGQKRHVVVFRLIAAGSLEELVYTRQVYKQQLSNIAVSGKMEKRYFEGVQDHKQFQGELFGISNLFRDLSDKLFTSEIIEHENQSHKYVSQGSKHQQKKDLGVHFAPSTEVTVSSISGKTKTDQPLLEELGILYSHRYEDIVNFGGGSKVSKADNDDVKGSCRALSKEDKKIHFSLIAKFAGMTEIEFSKWLLSASPLERENILHDYKKRRKKNVSTV